MIRANTLPLRRLVVALIVVLATLLPPVLLSTSSGCSLGEDEPVGIAQSAMGTNRCVTYDASAPGCPDGSATYATLNDAVPYLKVGDIVFVVGGGPAYQQDVVFPKNCADAAADAGCDLGSSDGGDPFASCPPGGIPGKITICGVPGPDGGRPILKGTNATVTFNGNHYIFENIEVVSASSSVPAGCVSWGCPHVHDPLQPQWWCPLLGI